MISKNFVVDFVQKTKAVAEDINLHSLNSPLLWPLIILLPDGWILPLSKPGLGQARQHQCDQPCFISDPANIGYDHMNMLGNTLTEIAGEKAGIIKERYSGCYREKHPETLPVFFFTKPQFKTHRFALLPKT